MNSGMYPAVSGALAAQQRLDVVSSNLAGASVAGYKRGGVAFESYMTDAVRGQQGVERPLLVTGGGFADMSQGPMRQTGGVLDLAIEGDGFFALQTPEGVRYTRNGTFRVDVNGFLVSGAGHFVLAAQKPVNVAGSEIKVAPDGTVTVDEAEVGRLDTYRFGDPTSLVKLGGSLYAGTGAVTADATVRQGVLEESNVNPVSEMIGMIEASRQFEMCTKVIQSYDEISAKTSNELGRV